MTSDDKSNGSNPRETTAAGDQEAGPGNRYKPSMILLSSTILMLVWKYFGTAEFYSDSLANRFNLGHPESLSAFYQFGSCLVLLGVVPALIIKLGFRERLGDYGFQFGHRVRTFRSILIAVPILAIGGCLAAMSDPSLRAAFPINKQAGLSTPFLMHAVTYALFYLGWEFHFRGFLQFGLSDSMAPGAVLIQVMASSLLHIGQPFVETFAAIVAGMVWGWLAFRTNSIVSGTVQHFALGIALDATIVFS